MTTISPNPLTTTEQRLEKLEKENRNLRLRLEKVEKGRSSILWEVIRLTLLLLAIAFLLHYMGFLPKDLGFLPQELERLPLSAKTVDAETAKVHKMEANEFILVDSSGNMRGKWSMGEQEPSLIFLDKSGHPSREITASSKP